MDNSNDYLVFGQPQIEEAEIAEVLACMESCWLGTGPRVQAFEKAFAAYKEMGDGGVAAVNSCTAALHLAMVASGVGPGDEVITTPMTFCATVNAILHTGATPVLADIDPHTFNLDPATVEAVITPATKAILLVHFGGLPCDMDRLKSLADEHDLMIIEDCAHAIESRIDGKPAGTLGDMGCFSFYATKNLTTGEGGMVIASDEKLISRIKVLALHGMSKDAWHRFGDTGYRHYRVTECGFKYNMMDLQAAIGLHQLQRLDSNLTVRENIWQQYDKAFSDLDLQRPIAPPEGVRHARHLYTILVPDSEGGQLRDRFLNAMHNRGIGTGVHYLSVPEHPYYQTTLGLSPKDFPLAWEVGRRTLSLPLSAKLTDNDVARVIQAVREVSAEIGILG